jgi:hypothetical protein
MHVRLSMCGMMRVSIHRFLPCHFSACVSGCIYMRFDYDISLLCCAHANVHTQIQNKQEKVSYQRTTSPSQDVFKLLKTTGETCSNSTDRLPSNGFERVPSGLRRLSSWESEVVHAKQLRQYLVSCNFVCVWVLMEALHQLSLFYFYSRSLLLLCFLFLNWCPSWYMVFDYARLVFCRSMRVHQSLERVPIHDLSVLRQGISKDVCRQQGKI